MLACVCQPTDSAIFNRRSPIPLGAPPLRLRPGRPRKTLVITEQPPSDNDATTTAITKRQQHQQQQQQSATVNLQRRSKNVTAAAPPEDDAAASPKGPKDNGVKLPDGVQLTLSELREMACRQQQQIESQHALLAAKEQRLRYLKEQEARQQRVAAESERLRRLRDRVDAQELKLRKLRALRGQVDQHKQNNVSLTSDLDSIRALFNEKEKELSLAVAKVEELTRQLEELRRGRPNRDQPPPASALELDKLRRELMYRNKLNEQQNARLSQQREALTARQEEMSSIDKRICELQERLHRKRVLNQQLANQISAASHKAAYQQLVRLTTGSGSEQHTHGYPRKPSQPSNQQHNGLSRGNIAAVEPYNHVPNAHHVRSSLASHLENPPTYYPVYQQNHIKDEQEQHQTNSGSSPNDHNAINQDATTKKSSNLYTPRIGDHQDPKDCLNEFTVSKSDPKYQTLPYNTKFTVNLISTGFTNKVQKDDNNILDAYSKDLDVQQQQQIQQATHMTVHSAPLSTVNKSLATPLGQNDLVGGSRKNGIDMAAPQPNTAAQYYQKPISSVAPTSVHPSGPKLSAIYQTSSIKVQPVEPQTVGSNGRQMSPAVQSPSSLVLSPPQSSSTPLGTPELTGGSDKIPRPALPPKPVIKPPPRQTQPEKETSPPPVPQTEPPDDTKPDNSPIIKAKPLTIKKQPMGEQPKLRGYNSKTNGVQLGSNRRIEMPPAFHFPEMEAPPADLMLQSSSEVNKGLDQIDRALSNIEAAAAAAATAEEEAKHQEAQAPPSDGVIRRGRKGNLKQTGKVNLSRRVSFDPLALLLDASLEGELELVKKTAGQVTNPSAANDEGITALHNAICAGHLEIVKFLVEFGCDVNAQDSDGWTPLHCAASCNNVAMVRFLVEHGACIFATTLSDHETAAEKCEEDEEGFDGCSEYLYSVQEKLGILSGGVVFAVFDYTAQQPDELSFSAGQQLTVLRKGDEHEREWWWSRLGDTEGYVPRNLLGLYPRVCINED